MAVAEPSTNQRMRSGAHMYSLACHSRQHQVPGTMGVLGAYHTDNSTAASVKAYDKPTGQLGMHTIRHTVVTSSLITADRARQHPAPQGRTTHAHSQAGCSAAANPPSRKSRRNMVERMNKCHFQRTSQQHMHSTMQGSREAKVLTANNNSTLRT